MHRFLAPTAILVLCLIPAPLASAWHMFQGNVRHTGRSPYAGPKDAIALWDFPIGEEPGTPVQGPDGTVYLPSGLLGQDDSGFVYAVNPNGTQKWRTTIGMLPSSTAPAVAGDTTVYVHGNGLGGNLAAIEVLAALDSSGTLKWTFEFNSGAAMFTSYDQSAPVVGSDGVIYVGSIDTRLYAVNPNGTMKWRGSIGACSIFASPVIDAFGRIIVVDGCHNVACFDAEGTIVWQVSVSSVTGGVGSPSIGDDGTIYVCNSSERTLAAIDSGGTIMWSAGVGDKPPRCTPAIGSDGTIYVVNDGLYAVDPSGSVLWIDSTGTSDGSASALVGGDGLIYWRTNNSGLLATHPNGAHAWTDGYVSPQSTGKHPSFVLMEDGTLVAPMTGGSLKGLRAFRAPLSKPILVSPADDTVGVRLDPVFAWQTLDNATAYAIEVALDEGFGQTVFSATSVADTFVPSSILANFETHYWHVKGYGGTDSSLWSETRQFRTIHAPPTLVSPSDGAMSESASPMLRWTQAPGYGASYRLQVATDDVFGHILVDTIVAGNWTDTSAQVHGLDNYTSYSWRVKGIVASDTSDWSETWSFTTAVGTVTLVGPADGAVGVGQPPTLCWEPLPGATAYRLQLSWFFDLNTVWIDTTVQSDTECVIDGLSNSTTYYWHVRGSNDDGTGEWSVPWGFTTAQPVSASANGSWQGQAGGRQQPGGSVLAYPSPAPTNTGKIAITAQVMGMTPTATRIYDAMGNLVHSFTRSSDKAGSDDLLLVEWDLRNQSRRLVGPGTYLALVELSDANGRSVTRSVRFAVGAGTR